MLTKPAPPSAAESNGSVYGIWMMIDTFAIEREEEDADAAEPGEPVDATLHGVVDARERVGCVQRDEQNHEKDRDDRVLQLDRHSPFASPLRFVHLTSVSHGFASRTSDAVIPVSGGLPDRWPLLGERASALDGVG